MAENMKFRVKSPKHSQEIQEVLFRCGYSWPGAVPGVKSSDDVEMTDEPFLFAMQRLGLLHIPRRAVSGFLMSTIAKSTCYLKKSLYLPTL